MPQLLSFILLTILIFFAGARSSLFISFFSPQGTIIPAAVLGNFDTQSKTATFNNQELIPPTKDTEPLAQKIVLGETNAEKRIEIDLASQRLYAFEGTTKVHDFLISSGKWGKTPTGIFQIWGKFRYVRMNGGSKLLKTDYDLPNVPFTMFFYNNEVPKWKGFGIHGTYWHSNFGHPMSHGCINMKTSEASLLYYWANPPIVGPQSVLATDENPGTTVIIYGIAPNT